MVIPRAYEPLDAYLEPGRALVVYGPRRVGKTTLLKRFLAGTALRYRLDSGDNSRTRELLSSHDFERILGYAEGYDLIAIDEAQGIPGIGKAVKILVDQIPSLCVILTGSSSFELAGQVGEPLTGRKRTLTLFPISQGELLSTMNRQELRDRLPEWLVFGSYPEVIEARSRSERIESITEIAHSCLLKDILAFDRVRSSATLLNLLRLVAFQLGSEVSGSELASRIGADVKTVLRYLGLLEKAFVLLRVGGFSRNLRQEVTRSAKYYFYDTGIRNALIAQFNDLELRNDVGALFENFVFVERLKHRTSRGIPANPYFWRTWDQQEIDLVEEREGKLFGYEMKWSSRRPVRAPRGWRAAYPEAEFATITPDDYLHFVSDIGP